MKAADWAAAAAFEFGRHDYGRRSWSPNHAARTKTVDPAIPSTSEEGSDLLSVVSSRRGNDDLERRVCGRIAEHFVRLVELIEGEMVGSEAL